MLHKVYLSSILLFVSVLIFAQPIKKSNSKADTTSFKIQTNYLNNYTYKVVAMKKKLNIIILMNIKLSKLHQLLLKNMQKNQ